MYYVLYIYTICIHIYFTHSFLVHAYLLFLDSIETSIVFYVPVNQQSKLKHYTSTHQEL